MKTHPSSWFWFALGGAGLGLWLWRRLLPRPLEVQTLVATVEPGASVAEAARHAAELAGDEARFRVEFEFNGVRVTVEPGVPADEIASAIRYAQEAKQDSVHVWPMPL